MYTCSEPSVPFWSPVNSTAAAATAPVNGTREAAASNSTETGDANVTDPQEDFVANSTAIDSEGSLAPTGGGTGEGGGVGVGVGGGVGAGVGGGTAVSGDSGEASPPKPSIAAVGPEVATAGGALMLLGEGFGQEVADVRVMVGGRDCRDPELCNRVCRPCGEDGRCDFNEMCVKEGLSKEKVCVLVRFGVFWCLFLGCVFCLCVFGCLGVFRGIFLGCFRFACWVLLAFSPLMLVIGC